MSSSILTSSVLLGSVAANSLVMQMIVENQAASDNIYLHNPAVRPSSFKQQDDPELVLCTNGFATFGGESYPCDNVDLYSFMAIAELNFTNDGAVFGPRMADIWGWYSEATGREITLAGMDNGFVAVDTTDPYNPCTLANYPTALRNDIWDDVKVVGNTAFHVKDSRVGDTAETNSYGIEVYDLLKLDSLFCDVEGYIPPTLSADYGTPEHGRAHNLVSNPRSNRIYSVGSQICSGGLVAYSLDNNRLEPEFLGCADADGYSHDAQCVIYTGPDSRYTGQEICFAFNEDTLTIWDVTDMALDTPPVLISVTPYNNSAYAHQGWLNRDMSKVLLDDELDELCNLDIEVSARCRITGFNLDGTLTTTTNVFDVSDLEEPVRDFVYEHNDPSIDHNLYVFGAMHEQGMAGNPPLEYFPDPNIAYLNNYQAGLKILDISSDNPEDWETVGMFDVSPEQTDLVFAGAWSGYLHPSGVYALNSIERGLFLLAPRMVFSEEFPAAPSTEEEGEDDDELDTEDFLTIAVAALSVIVLVLLGLLFKKGSPAATSEQIAKQEVEVKQSI